MSETIRTAPTQGDLDSGNDLSQRVASVEEAKILADAEKHGRAQERISRQAAKYALELVRNGEGDHEVTTDELTNAVGETEVGVRENGTPVTLRDLYSDSAIRDNVRYSAQPMFGKYARGTAGPGAVDGLPVTAREVYADAKDAMKSYADSSKQAVRKAQEAQEEGRAMEEELNKSVW